MNKRGMRVIVWVALLAVGAWIILESRREPDRVAEAIKVVPDGCVVEGVWRREDYPPPIEHLKNTIIICRSPQDRQMFMVYDDQLSPAHVLLNADGSNDVNTDVFTINPDGSLTISDELGEVVTVQAAPN